MGTTIIRRVGRGAATLAVAALLAVTLVTGQQSRPAPVFAQVAADSFVGRIAGSDAFIGVVSDGRGVIAYVCDSALRADWFRGEIFTSVNAGTIDLTSPSGARLRLELSSVQQGVLDASSAPRGQLEIGGTNLNFQTEVASAGAGVFRAERNTPSQSVLAGWIVLNDGDVRGAAIDRLADQQLGPSVIGLGPDSADLTTLQGYVPGFDILDIQRLDAASLDILLNR